MSRRRLFAGVMAQGVGSDTVERPSKGEAPTAWRIWTSGENFSDKGSIFFTNESARLLLSEQEARQRRYVVDFDHLSLTTDRPAEAGRAAGWHSLAVRNGELWAVDVEWCADAKAGLEEKPPRWKYFSPAFHVDKSDQVVSYVNCALCVNPLSRGIPELAAFTRGKTMDLKKVLALLAAMAEGEGVSDEQKQAVAAALSFLSPEEKKDNPEEKPEEKKDAEKSEDTPPPPSPASPPAAKEDEKEKASAVGVGSLAALAARLEVFEVREALTGRVDIPEGQRRWLRGQPLAVVRSYLAEVPRGTAERHASATLGDGAPMGLQGEELEMLNRAMGIRSKEKSGPERDEFGRLVLRARGAGGVK